MKTTIRTTIARSALTALVTIVTLAACNNPLQVGLGENVDIDRPEGDISSPNAGNYLRGVVTLDGSHSDDTTSIPEVTLSFDGGASTVTATVTASEWSYELDTTTLPDGELEVLITITDASGKSVDKRQLYYVDNSAPIVLVKNPQGYASNKFNGLVTVRGEAADLHSIDSVRVQVLDDAGDELSGLDLADGTNSWTFEFDSRIYADPAGDLQIVVQATDIAGNVSTTLVHYDDVLNENGGQRITVEDLRRISEGTNVDGATIDTAALESITMGAVPTSIDNDLDKPTVSFVSPQNGQTVGGSVLVTGTAYDDDGLERVEMRIDLNGDGDYDDAFDLNGDGDTTDVFETESTWVTLDGTVLWTQELNADGELYQVEAGHNGQVAIQVRAVDINSPEVVGNPVEIAVRFDDTIPRVEGLEVDGRTFISGISVSGTFSLKGEIRDDEQVNRVRISYDGGITYTDVFNRDGAINDGSITENAVNHLSLDKTIDTSNIPGLGALTSEPLYIRLLVFDNNSPTPYQVLSYVTLNVDNVYPTGTWDTGNVDPLNIAGSAAAVQGTAEDTGSVSGVEEIHVYFVRGGQVYDLAAYNTTTPTDTTNFGDGNGDVAYAPPNGASGAPPRYRIEIDNEIEGGDDTSGGGDGDGFDESLTLSSGVYTWSAEFDSTTIPDGAIDIHYVVFDSAGNGTHYVEPGFIKNNPPVLNTVELGTDLNADGDTADSGERTVPAISAGALPVTGFTAVNDLLFVDLNATGGNGTITYSIEESTQPGVELITSGSTAVIDTSVYGDGTRTFTATLTDSVGIEATATLEIDVANADTIPPSITFETLDQTNVKGFGGTLEGHLEADGESLHDGADADVSGTMILDGTGSDDQRLSSITVQIDSFDAGSGVGAIHEVASWNGATNAFESSDANFTIVSQSLTEAGGHDVDWEYEWDSSGITGVAGNNVEVRFDAADFGPNSATDSLQTVDVVPYITEVATQLTQAFPSAPSALGRSATGAYPVRRGETVSIYGFNFTATTAAVSIGGTDAGTPTEIVGPPAGIAVTVPAGATTGDLVVAVAGVNSTNNLNQNGGSQNLEPNGVNNPLLTDDRVLNVWDFTTIAGTASARYPIMRISPSNEAVGFSYASGETQFAMIGSDGVSDVYETNYTRYNYTTFGFDTNGNVYGAALNSDRISNTYGGSSRLGFFYRQPGSRSTGGNDGYNNGTYKRHIEHNWNGTVYDSLRSQYPDMDVQGGGTAGDPATIALSYYDASEKLVKFRYGAVDGGADGDVSGAISQDYDNNVTGTNGSVDGYQTIAGTSTAGPFSTVAVTQAGVAVVAWYDSTNRYLRYSYNTNPAGASEAQWATNAIVIDDFFAGQYVDIAADPAGGIHIAYYSSSSGDLKYAYLASYDAGTAQTVTVDSFLSVGQNITVQTRLEGPTHVPYISYYVAAYDGTLNSLKLAQRLPTAGALSDGMTGDQYTGSWEVQSVPAPSIPKSYTVSIGFVGTTPVVGYASDAGLQYGQLY